MKNDTEYPIKEWSSSQLKRLRTKALDWYRHNGRDLPWRRTSDPYAIWISEIMLQQTQVSTVIPYFERFLKAYPDVRGLAKANLDDVYLLWAGLGYYRRARQMHEAAQVIVSKFMGEFPSSFDDVLSLPGIGRYTAGAILSFAMDQRLPIVEANTQRLYARLLHLGLDTSASSAQLYLWNFADQILPRSEGSGELNQAMMEIGSQICVPKTPNCLDCPLNTVCPTFERGTHAVIPLPKKPKTYTDLKEIALVIRNSTGRFLMRRCQSEERWAGLWDFPRFDVTTVSAHSLQRHLATTFAQKYGQSVLIGKPLCQIKHSVTRYRISLQAFDAELENTSIEGSVLAQDAKWITSSQMEKLALSSSGSRIWKWLKANEVSVLGHSTKMKKG